MKLKIWEFFLAIYRGYLARPCAYVNIRDIDSGEGRGSKLLKSLRKYVNKKRIFNLILACIV